VWPDSNYLLSDGRQGVQIHHDERQVIDWTVDQVMVELLGLNSPRSTAFEHRLSRYSALKRKNYRSADEDREFQQLTLWADEALGSDDSARRLISALVGRLTAETEAKVDSE
jgi:hypothetical protein